MIYLSHLQARTFYLGRNQELSSRRLEIENQGPDSVVAQDYKSRHFLKRNTVDKIAETKFKSLFCGIAINRKFYTFGSRLQGFGSQDKSIYPKIAILTFKEYRHVNIKLWILKSHQLQLMLTFNIFIDFMICQQTLPFLDIYPVTTLCIHAKEDFNKISQEFLLLESLQLETISFDNKVQCRVRQRL